MPLRWRGFPYKISNPRFKHTIYGGGFIKDNFAAAGFEGPVDGEDWDVLWTHKPQVQALQKIDLQPRAGRRLVNHCFYFVAAGDKCRLAKLVNSIQASGPATLPSFELDDQKQLEQWQRLVLEKPDQHWVLKPCLGGASKGIQIRKGQEALDAQASFGRHSVAQQYLEKPYLGFGGRKFHLRLYLLVTRWAPLGAHLYDDGLVFRSAHEHRPHEQRSEARDAFSSISQEVEALPLADLWNVLDSAGHGTNTSLEVWGRIKEALRNLLTAGTQEMFGTFENVQVGRSFSCFDLLGADVLLDEELRPSVMEFNIGPNMWVDDHGVKHKERLFKVKNPMVQQVVEWAALSARTREPSLKDTEHIEGSTLLHFSRLI